MTPVAQWTERPVPDREAGGSSPLGRALPMPVAPAGVRQRRKHRPTSGDDRHYGSRVDAPAAPAGWPKLLRCLKCGVEREAEWAGDRLHPRCR